MLTQPNLRGKAVDRQARCLSLNVSAPAARVTDMSLGQASHDGEDNVGSEIAGPQREENACTKHDCN